MSLQVGGLRRNAPSVRNIAFCQNPHCRNKNLTRMQDYVACVCGWNTRMNAQDVLDKFGPYPKPTEFPGEATEHMRLFLKSRGYAADTLEFATNFVNNLDPEKRDGFLADAALWSPVPTGQAVDGAQATGRGATPTTAPESNWRQCVKCSAAYEATPGTADTGVCFGCRPKEQGDAQEPTTIPEATSGQGDSGPAKEEGGVGLPTGADMDAVAAEQKATADTDDTDPETPVATGKAKGKKK